MPATLILAKNTQEANHYAKVIGLPRFTYRAVRDAGAIRGVRNAEVHVLRSFLKRPDRHNILSALRNARWTQTYYVVFEDGKIVDPNPPATFVTGADGTTEAYDGMVHMVTGGVHSTKGSLDRATREEILQEMSDEIEDEEPSEPTAETEPSEDPAPAEKPERRRRRTRCKDCGNLHYKDEPCDTEFDSGEPVTPTPAPTDFIF